MNGIIFWLFLAAAVLKQDPIYAAFGLVILAIIKEGKDAKRDS